MSQAMRHVLGGGIRRWSAATYGAFFVLFALPFATLYAACSHERLDTVNGYQTLAQHDYSYQAADGSTKIITVGSDGFSWITIAFVAVAIVISLLGFRTIWLSVISVASVFTLFLAVAAAGGSKATSEIEIGYWLSSVGLALAPAADVRPWRRAALVAAATLAASAAFIGAVIGLIVLIARASG